MKKIALILVLTLGSQGIFAQNVDVFFSDANSFLSTYVSKGRVDYSKLNENPESLNKLMASASVIKVAESDAETYQAFWINAYNLAVIKGVIDNYPIKSPLDKPGFFDKTTYELGGKAITLNDIEHKLLRPKFNDARFHFVLVCGAIGCPPLISEAYLPDTLNAQLDKQTTLALNGDFLKVNTKKKRVEGSEILKWYKEDFTMNGTTEFDFINTYRKEKVPNNFKLTYFTYNWNLNKK